MEEGMVVSGGDELVELPPGFRFHPTDEEIITCYLTEKVINSCFVATAISEADLNKCEPWDLPKKEKMGEKEWYFCQRDRKYPTGMRTNRATESGYWKATGKDKEIFNSKGKPPGCLVGMKKTLVFYRGRAPKGEKTNWVMHEYRLEGKISHLSISKAAKDEWVVCRVFHKNLGLKKTITPIRTNSFGNHDLLDCSSLPPLMDPTNMNITNSNIMTNEPSGFGDHDFKPGPNLAAPPSFSAKTSDDHHAISRRNYLNYFSVGGRSQGLKQNHNFQQQPTSNYTTYQASLSNSITNPNILYPHHPIHHHQFPNPSNFSFQPNPSNSDYFQQGMRGSSSTSIPNSRGFLYRTSTTSTDDDHAMLRETAGANNHNMNETSSSAGFGISSLERQCKVEQFSFNHSMFSLSQDTGLSTDVNTTEISSSLVSKQELGSTNNSSYEQDLHEGSSVFPISEIEGLWDF